MPKTALGLFENSESAEAVVEALVAAGLPRDEIRTLKEPHKMAVAGILSSPHTDFRVRVERDLTAMGATIEEADACALGLRNGGVLVFATGSEEEAQTACDIMDRQGAQQLEILNGREPGTIGHASGIVGRLPEMPHSTGRVRQRGAGARLFTW